MGVKISHVKRGSIAAKKGLKVGDVILKINDQEINDFIDLQFHTAANSLQIIISDCNNHHSKVVIDDFWEETLGIEIAPYTIKRCRNNCLFCFIDQMPKGLREPLYLKDDDYLYSFVFGNYISLNNMSEKEFQRIAEQKISPLYISVHSTDPELRAKIMGYKEKFDILEKLLWLSNQNISFHTQIVLVPNVNDVDKLNKTLNDLTQTTLNTLSIGIVPVGLTKHRQQLPHLMPFNKETALAVIEQVTKLQHNNVYLADEFFLTAGLAIPSEEYYDDFCQIENGIGMVRTAIDNFFYNKELFSDALESNSSVMITGTLASSLIFDFAKQINTLKDKEVVKTLVVENDFFGKTVTVSGLITWADINKKLSASHLSSELLILSSNMFNTDGFTIDNVHYKEIKTHLNCKLLIVDELWNGWFFV